MQKQQLNSKGFGLIAELVVIAVLIILGGAGAYVYHRDHKAKNSTTTSSTSATSANSTQAGKNGSTPPPADPYAGWKTYIDSQHHYSFKYPSDWILDANSGQVTVLNPSKNLEVDYVNPYVHDSGLLSFDPVSVTDLNVAGLSLKIVGGVYSPANEPDYGVVDASLLTQYPLTVGQTAQFPNALRFTDTHASDSSSVAFRARATSSLTTQEAQAWFNTTDAKTSLLILQSLSYQQ